MHRQGASGLKTDVWAQDVEDHESDKDLQGERTDSEHLRDVVLREASN